MTTPTCFIWNTPISISAPAWTDARPRWIDDSPRAGGGYETDGFVGTDLHGLDDQQKALLTTWLIDERRQGNPYPRITLFGSHQLLEKLNPLQIGDRAHRLLTLLAGRSGTIGQQVSIALPDDESVNPNRYGAIDDVPELVCNLWRAMAWSESTTIGEVIFLVDYLVENGWLKRNGLKQPDSVSVTVEGYAHIEESRVNVGRSQAFVAMWFNDETDDAFDQGIQPAIEQAGYTAMRIDRKEDVNKIDDEIFAEIRNSRFLVADFTQGESGARGGVYWEDGFASGLGLEVIRTCRMDCIDKVAFDTRQYYHIVWESPEELREALRNRILAMIGEGPITPS
ncbi:MAG: hypothetical protein OXS30_07780 [Chloroflexota bacterium]|nr:hypothetical protein [Chloroflexota bacterium]